MGYLELLNNLESEVTLDKKIRIMIFAEGTILGPSNIFQYFNHASYVPIKNSVNVIDQLPLSLLDLLNL